MRISYNQEYIMLLFLSIACQTEPEPDFGERGACNPVEDAHCMLPFPSDFFREGGALAFSIDTLPVNEDDIPMSPDVFAHMDGFSVGSSLVVSLENATLDGVVQWPNLAPYAENTAKTVIINTSTGQRVPHTVEREILVSNNALLLLRPMVALDHGTTYVVGIRGLVDSQGVQVDPPSGFAQLIDASSTDTDIARQQETYDTLIFPTLSQEGFAKEELQLAWSFTTRTAQNTRAPIEHMRNTIDNEYSDISFSVESTEPEDCENNKGRVIKGSMEVPLFLEEWTGMHPLIRDEQGLPVAHDMVSVPFSVLVGCSLIEEERSGPLLQYGHGLFGTQGEVTTGYNHTLANTYGYVMFAADWTGMKRQDAPTITLTLIQNPSGFSYLTDRLHQGWMEFYALSKLMQSNALATHESFMHNDVSLIDSEKLYFYGNSQGAVLGGGYAAMNPNISRVILGVGGMPFNLLLKRAQGFEPFIQLMETMYRDSADITVMEILFEHLWEPVESVGWASAMDKPVLIQAAIGDCSVPTIGAQVMARSYGATLIEPYQREVFGLEPQSTPFEGSAYVEWDFGVPDSDGPYPAELPEDRNPHDDLRNQPEAMQQIHTFLSEGVVEHYCEGACSVP